ncbi:MAG: acyl-phosphate glycerol 3-phosphate acyltransferase [Candidatus Omnitrophica bacterium CG07_land_8_20_14_0_80_50_8]|nr:MAG: acyl-phosphate glycerol 3-phosphate acyltransferase [Candidatus Omnitrophica bacterium CG07_land_8_20_14_0_80_50_8]
MTLICLFIIFWLLAFLSGALPTAYLAGHFFKGTDIRLHGSGNVGATNAFRVLGKRIGALVFLIDFLKSWWPVIFLPCWLPPNSLSAREAGLWIGTGAIAGHVFTPFLGFKGGKGIAAGAGVLCGAFPLLFLVVLTTWLLVFSFTRIVSISSLAALAGLVIASFLLGLKASVIAFFCLVAFFIVWTHRSNIARLIQGKEKKIC